MGCLHTISLRSDKLVTVIPVRMSLLQILSCSSLLFFLRWMVYTVTNNRQYYQTNYSNGYSYNRYKDRIDSEGNGSEG